MTTNTTKKILTNFLSTKSETEENIHVITSTGIYDYKSYPFILILKKYFQKCILITFLSHTNKFDAYIIRLTGIVKLILL